LQQTVAKSVYCADRLVAEDRPGLRLRHVALEDVQSVPQIVVVSTWTITSLGSSICGSGTVSQALWPGPL